MAPRRSAPRSTGPRPNDSPSRRSPCRRPVRVATWPVYRNNGHRRDPSGQRHRATMPLTPPPFRSPPRSRAIPPASPVQHAPRRSQWPASPAETSLSSSFSSCLEASMPDDNMRPVSAPRECSHRLPRPQHASPELSTSSVGPDRPQHRRRRRGHQHVRNISLERLLREELSRRGMLALVPSENALMWACLVCGEWRPVGQADCPVCCSSNKDA